MQLRRTPKQRGRQPRRTLEPAVVPEVQSYLSRREPRQRTEGGRHQTEAPRKHPRLRRLVRLAAGWLLVAGVVYSLGLSTHPRVTFINPKSDTPLMRQENVYRDAAGKLLAGSWLSKTKVTLNTAGFESAMLAQFPELDQVSLTVPLISHTPLVELVAKRPALTLTTERGAFVIDKNGRVLLAVQDAIHFDSLKLQTIQNESKPDIALGRGVITSQDVSFILILSDQFSAASLPVDTMTLPTAAHQLKVRLKNTPYDLLFDMQNDPRLSAGTYLALKQRLDSDHTVPTSYVDLRLDERAYFK